jgi:hypothetical protein
VKVCQKCLEEIPEREEGYVYFHICKGKPKDFIIGEVVEEMKEIESS